MKAHNIIKSVLALSLAVIAVSSCQEKMKGFGFSKGEVVRFSVGTEGSSLDTKAAYAGNTTKPGEKERIDWEENDLIRIYCSQVSEPETHFADYKVTGNPTSSGALSKAHIEGTGGVGLRWGEGEHTFYAVYPSPASNGITTGINGNTVSGTLPSTDQGNKGKSVSDGNYVVKPDLKWMMMTAKAGPYSETGAHAGADGVFLSFTPLTTAIEFTIYNGNKNAALDVNKIMLISENTQISGTFTVDLDTVEGGYAKCTGTASDSKQVCRDFSSLGISLAKATGDGTANCKSLKFTFFLAPTTDVSDLTFKLYKNASDWMSTKLGYTDGSGVWFPCHKKSSVTGLIVPEGAQWTVKYAPDVDPWYPGGGDIDPIPEFSGNPIVTSWDTGHGESGDLELKPDHVKWIDLGLPSGKLWADRNVGANASYEVGDYYSWGETELWYTAIEGNTVTMKPQYNQFNWSEYAAKSNMKSIISNLTGTYAIYDVARLLYGSDCHIPLDNEYWELANNCYWKYVSSYDGQSVEGYMIFKAKADADKGKFTLKNPTYTPVATYSASDTHIFLPFSGFITKKTVRSGNIDDGDAGKTAGYYLTSTTGQVALTDSHAGQAGYERFAIGANSPTTATVPRYAGMPVRAVKQKQKTIEYVEIGGLKWATMNLGATKPEEPGLYFAWGDVVGQYAATTGTGAFSKSYEWKTTPFNNGKSTSQNTWFSNNQSLWITDDATLKPDYDAANVLIGGGWRMPTKEDLDNLLSNTNQGKVTDYNGTGVAGWICTSKTDDTKAIFLPATGYGDGTGVASSGNGYYWSSTLVVTNKGNAYRISLGEDPVTGNNSRYQGRCIRPVHD